MGKRKTKLKQGKYTASREVRRVVPLKANHCYIFDMKGKLNHVQRHSDRFNQLIEELRGELGDDRVEIELARLN